MNSGYKMCIACRPVALNFPRHYYFIRVNACTMLAVACNVSLPLAIKLETKINLYIFHFCFYFSHKIPLHIAYKTNNNRVRIEYNIEFTSQLYEQFCSPGIYPEENCTCRMVWIHSLLYSTSLLYAYTY